MVSWRTWLLTTPGREGPSKGSSLREHITWMPSKWAALGQPVAGSGPCGIMPGSHISKFKFPSKTELCMGRRMPPRSHDTMQRRAVGLDTCDSHTSCSLTPQRRCQPGSGRTADHSSPCPPGSDAWSGEEEELSGEEEELRCLAAWRLARREAGGMHLSLAGAAFQQINFSL